MRIRAAVALGHNYSGCRTYEKVHESAHSRGSEFTVTRLKRRSMA